MLQSHALETTVCPDAPVDRHKTNVLQCDGKARVLLENTLRCIFRVYLCIG